jgi:hypothetical protein
MLVFDDGVVDRGTYAQQWCSTSSFSSSRSRPSWDNQTDQTLQCHEEWMQYIISMVHVKYLQVLCNFSNFIQILLNRVLHDFLQQGYTPYGGTQPPLFSRTTTPGDPSTPHVDSMQVNDTTALYSSQNLDY